MSTSPKPPRISADPSELTSHDCDIAPDTDHTAVPDLTRLPDFTTLPDMLWMVVLKMLTARDRYHLALTCNKLHSLFRHPSVWSSVVLDLPTTKRHVPHYHKAAMILPWQTAMVERFGPCFRDVTVCLEAFDIQPQCYQALSALCSNNNNSRVESFTIKVTQEGSSALHFREVSERVEGDADVLYLMQEISTRRPGARLHLDAHFWQVDDGLYEDIIMCPSSDLRCRHLRTFHFKFAALTEFQLYSSIALLDKVDSYTPTAVLVSKFPCLQHLTLSDYNLSDELLHALADTSDRRCQLRTLTVDLAAYENNEEEDEERDKEEVHDISPEAWSQLASSCPQLRVFCFFKRPHNLDSIFKPEAPLVSIKVVSSCERELSPARFLSFCEAHSDTLESLQYDVCDYVDSFDHMDPDELPLVSILTACSKLRHLEYRGIIRGPDVMTLAEVDRRWRTLEISERYVSLPDYPLMAEEVTTDRLNQLQELRDVMSRSLGYTWEFCW